MISRAYMSGEQTRIDCDDFLYDDDTEN